MNKKRKAIMQFIATIIMVVSMVFMILENIQWLDFTFEAILNALFCSGILAGSSLLTYYYVKGNKLYLFVSHTIMMLGFTFRFCDFAIQCLFSQDVPGYSIFLFDLLPGLALISEIAVLVLLKKNVKSVRWKKIVLINSMIQIVFWGLAVLYGIGGAFASTYAMIESMSGLYGVTLLLLNINIALDFMKGEIDYLGENRVRS